MVSAYTFTATLYLASFGLAAPITSKERVSSSSLSSSAATSKHTSNSTITAAPKSTTTRPWYLQEFSEVFVHNAVAIRSKGISEEEASSVAKRLVDAGLSPPQYTSLASEALQMWVNDGHNPNATSLYHLATNAKSAYDEIHDSLGYWAYVDYVQTTAATVFDTDLLEPSSTAHLNGTAASRASRQRAMITSAYSSLYADPSGSAALEIMSDVANSYKHDFYGESLDWKSNAAVKLSGNMIENFLMSMLNSF